MQMDKETRAALVQLSEQIGELTKLTNRMDTRMASVERSISELETKLGNQIERLDGRIQYVELTLQTLDRLPPLIRRPKSFQAATELHSVSAPIRKRQGQMG